LVTFPPLVGSAAATIATAPHLTPAVRLFPWVPAGGYPDRFPYGWCTWWAAYNRHVTWNGNAADWLTNASAHGFHTASSPMVGAMVVELVLLAAAVVLAALRERERRRPGVQLDIVPPEGKSADLATWSKFYRKLFGVSYSPLKRLLYGQPSVVFELWSKDGDLGARCWAPARRAGMVTTLLRAALPGVLLQRSTAPIHLDGYAARARLRLDVDPLHALDGPQPE